jgi:hypothetical protein
MSKVHVTANKGTNGVAFVARCAGQVHNRVIRRNGRQSYQFMASEIVTWAEWRELPASRQCAHCNDQVQVWRARNGLAPYVNPSH